MRDRTRSRDTVPVQSAMTKTTRGTVTSTNPALCASVRGGCVVTKPASHVLVQVALACDHYTVVPFGTLWKSETLLCWACKHERAWVAFFPLTQGWNFSCTICSYARAFGEARVTCQTKAASHAVRKRHTVIIRIDARQVDTVSVQSSMTEVELPPF